MNISERSHSRLLVPILAFGLLLAGCGGSDQPDAPAPSQAPRPQNTPPATAAQAPSTAPPQAIAPSPTSAVEKRIFVGPQQVDCEGVGPQKCLQIKQQPNEPYTLFYDQIEGFDYQPGYEYELLIREERIADPPADASSIKWTLIRVVSKTAAGATR